MSVELCKQRCRLSAAVAAGVPMLLQSLLFALWYRCIALLTTLFEDMPLTLGAGVLCAPKMGGSSHYLAAAARSWITVEDALATKSEKLQSPHCAADISEVRV